MQDSTPDSWIPPSGRLNISEGEFANRKIKHIFPKLIDWMQPCLESGGLVGRITTDHPATASSTGIICNNTRTRRSQVKVDLSIFESSGGHLPGLISECDLTKEEEDASTSHHKHYLARADWDRILVPIAVESSTRPCAFEPVSAESESPEAETIGSGTVIEEPQKLLDFLFCLAKMSPAQRGYDTSIRPASEIEAKEFTAFLQVDSVAKAYLQDALRPDGETNAAIFRVNLQGLESSDMTVQLVFARPRILGKGVEGRATRGYVAYDLVNKRLVFLKDYWQPETKSYHLELDTYKRLQAKNVLYVATPVGGGHVGSDPCQPKGSSSMQRTLSQVYLSAAHGECYRARVHYRFAVQEICRPLEDYRDVVEMLRAVCFAVAAHKAAWEKAGVLHRDISPGNILITENGRGILNDWDMCKYKEDVGTWRFMSALLLCCPEKPNEVSDDVESFVHVINWLTLRYQIDSSPFLVDYSLRFYEEYRRTEAGEDVGGNLKLANFKDGITLFCTTEIRPVALQLVVREMMKMCKEHYFSPGVVDRLIRSGVEAPVKPLVLSATSRPHKMGPLPDWGGGQPYPVKLPKSAPVDSKPLMDDHQRIVEILMGALRGITDPQLWEGPKLKDQFLKRSTHVESDSGTASGLSAGTQGDGAAQQHSQSGLKSTHIDKVSITHSKRNLASSEEFEGQGKSKRVKRSDEGRPVAGSEGHGQAGDR
ncbi:hypothetical protein NLI96_g4578 [Meripilus lineatus]|uniref:Protein kinase domain-containing protein n=1 Tax=Meripilus lineatus TaxID=2056292 RepID=A0AAD5V4N5_9APHY|nr:hypothetical protein NLI96_g4578 [Physisporinus lineatus]